MDVSSATHLGDRNGADLQLLPPRHHLKLHPRPERVPGQVHVVLAQERQTLSGLHFPVNVSQAC